MQRELAHPHRPLRAAALLLTALLLLALCLGLMAWLAAPANADGTERRVPADYATIQAAIDAAQPGDVIKVAAFDDQDQPLTYAERLVISSSLTLVGGLDSNYAPVDGAHTTVDGEGQGRVVTILPAGPGVTVRLESVLLSNGDATGLGGVVPVTVSVSAPFSSVQPLVELAAAEEAQTQNVLAALPAQVAQLAAAGHYPGGATAAQAAQQRLAWLAGAAAPARPALANTWPPVSKLPRQGLAPDDADCGGGLYARGAAVTLIEVGISASRASANEAGYGGGACILDAPAGTLLIADSSFDDNAASTGGDGHGGGLWLQNAPSARIEATNFADNVASNAGGNGFGGGFALTAVPGATLTDLIVARNTASMAGSGAGGGGLILQSSALTLLRPSFTGNAASLAMVLPGGDEALGAGGALLLDRVDATTIISGSFEGNAAGLGGQGWGGAIAGVNLAGIDIDQGIFQRNFALFGPRYGIGGAIGLQKATDVVLHANQFYANVGSSAMNGAGIAGAIWINTAERVRVQANSFCENTGSLAGEGAAGAILFNHLVDAQVEGNSFHANWATVHGTSGTAGAALIGKSQWLTFTDNLVEENVANMQQGIGGANQSGGVGGGVVFRGVEDALIAGNVITGNTALLLGGRGGEVFGGGLLLAEATSNEGAIKSARVVISGNHVAGNTALLQGPQPDESGAAGVGVGGGIFAAAMGLLLQGNVVEHNFACVTSCSMSRGSGMAVVGDFQSDESTSADATITGNWLQANGLPVDESALYIGVTDGITVTNNTLAGNLASEGALAISLAATRVEIEQGASIVNNSLYANGGPAIVLLDWNDTVAQVDNNAIVSHTVGVQLQVASARAELRYNLFGDNGTDVQGPGTFTNTAPITGPVHFVAPGALDLHLAPNSAAIDAGDPAGVPPAPSVDIENAPRPYGLRVDVGAYEWHGQGALLPIVAKP